MNGIRGNSNFLMRYVDKTVSQPTRQENDSINVLHLSHPTTTIAMSILTTLYAEMHSMKEYNRLEIMSACRRTAAR